MPDAAWRGKTRRGARHESRRGGEPRALGLGATLHVPVLRHGRLEALLAIHFAHPQALGEDSRRLAEEAAKLAWTSLTHARAELALRTSSAQLAAMFDQASAGIAVCDRNWRFTRVNDRYCEIAGRSRETLLGLRMQDIPRPRRLRPPAAPGGATGAAFEMSGRCVRPDGDTVWVQNQVTPLVDEQHAASGLLCVHGHQRAGTRRERAARTQRKPGRTCRDHARPARKRPGAASRGTQDGDGRPVDRRHRP